MVLDTYLAKFARLRPDKNRYTWPAETRHCSPYKPLLLLSILDQFATGALSANLIEPSEDLAEQFLYYCTRVLSPSYRSTMSLPFFHLQSQGFWHLVPRVPGATVVTPNSSLKRLREQIYGARLDDALYALVLLPLSRGALRQVLIETYFSDQVYAALQEQSLVNQEAFHYSQNLFRQARQKIKEALPETELYRPAARDQGFRRAVISAYDHTCAFCSLRLLTPEGHTAADAAHIVPWSQTHNDTIENGMALCKLCHWGFDEGLLTASANYRVQVSSLLFADYNAPASLALLKERALTLPQERAFWPAPGALDTHRRDIYRSR